MRERIEEQHENCLPSISILELKYRDDFNWNCFDNSFSRYLKQIKFSNADLLNPAYRDGVNVIDFNEDIDKEGVNGASSELSNNERESRKDLLNLPLKGKSHPLFLN